MSCCCTNPANLGCANICGDWAFNLMVAQIKTDYVFIVKFQNTEEKIVKPYDVGQVIQLTSADISNLNEDYTYEVLLFTSDAKTGVLISDLGCYVFSTVYTRPKHV